MNNEDKILRLLETVAADVGTLKSDVGTLTETVGNIDNRLSKVEMKLEHDVANKIGVLFDAWQGMSDKNDQQAEQLDHITNQVEHIAADTKLLVRRIVKLEKVQ